MDYSLKELLDVPRLHELLRSFNEIYHMPSAVIDVDGTVLTSTAWQDICKRFHRMIPELRKFCVEEQQRAKAPARAGRHVTHRCPMGLVDVAAPIVVDGHHLGDVFVGQLFTEPPDEERFIEQARRYGFDEIDYLEAIRTVPLFTEADLHSNLTFIHALAQMLAEQGMQNLRRKEVQDALHRSDLKFRSVIESAPIPIAMNDGSGKILYLNRCFSDLFGYTVEDVPTVEQWWPRAYPDLDYRNTVASAWERELHEARTTGRPFAPIEARIVCKDGATRTALCSAIWLPESFTGTSVVFLYDLTERKKMEEQLTQSEENYRCISEITSDFVYKCSRMGDAPYSVTWAGGGLKVMSGYSPREICEVGCWMGTVHPDDRERVMAHMMAMLPGEQDVIEFRMISKEGEVRWISETSLCVAGKAAGELVRYGASRDVTEMKKVEAKLEMIRISVDAASDAIYWIRGDGRIIDVNPAACRSVGYTREEIMGMRVWDLDIQHKEDAWLKHFEELRTRGTIVFESRHRTKGGGTVPIEVVANYVHFDHQELNCAFVRDIAERKQAERERQRLQAQKLESLGTLAGGVAHDFNNILTSIIGNADLAMMQLSPESPVLGNLQRIEKSAEKAADLARQMLAYSGKGKFLVQSLDLSRLIEEMEGAIRDAVPEPVQLRYQLATSLPPVDADPGQIRQVVMNLVCNAAEAIGDREGVIELSTGAQHCDGGFFRDAWPVHPGGEGRYVFIGVSDNGCGMDQDTAGRIFDPFFSTKFTGRGLGMAAVMGIVRGHRGGIKVLSDPGVGTTIRVFLPAAQESPKVVEAAGGTGLWQGHGRVLLVDDEDEVRSVGGELLKALGFTVVTAADGEEAVQRFSESRDFSFVILDLTMPRMDGEQCYRALHSIDPVVKVIIASGYSEQEVARKFTGAAVTGFVQKPYRLATLRDAVRKLQ
ncbi:PocR ligand-binding domain-containing protein [Geomonas edaphica]|uniref:PocR ligand-binding domain-containing protein n=1 Tax=Geomonas edaphica TaxID=2570226 RepID=UPI0010A93CE5|nr:PocR ligand-binding domain-containing protein [Geomonas edaphica]